MDLSRLPHYIERRQFLEVIAVLGFLLGVLRFAFDVFKYFDAKK